MELKSHAVDSSRSERADEGRSISAFDPIQAQRKARPAGPRPRVILLIPRFSVESSRRVMRALRRSLATAGGYAVALEDPTSCVDVFVDIVVFNEPLFQTAGDGCWLDAADGGEHAQGGTGLARTILEFVEASFCMVLDGSDTYLTSNVQPSIQRILEGACGAVLGAIWHTERPSAPSGKWKRVLLRLRNLVSRKANRDVLSGLFVIEGGLSAATNANPFVAENDCF